MLGNYCATELSWKRGFEILESTSFLSRKRGCLLTLKLQQFVASSWSAG